MNTVFEDRSGWFFRICIHSADLWFPVCEKHHVRGGGCCHSNSFPCCCPCKPGAGASPMDSHSQPRRWVGFPSPDRQAVCRGGGLAQARRGMGSATRLGSHPIRPHAVLLTGCPREQPLPIRKSNWGEHQSISGEVSLQNFHLSHLENKDEDSIAAFKWGR